MCTQLNSFKYCYLTQIILFNINPSFAWPVGWGCRIHRLLLCRGVRQPTMSVLDGPVGWGCRIHWLLLDRGIRPLNECPVYDTKQSDSKVLVMLELWGIRSTPSLPSPPGPFWPGEVGPNRVLSMGQRIKLYTFAKLNCLKLFWHLNCVFMLNWIVWNGTVFVC